jgi:hypothetical protein
MIDPLFPTDMPNLDLFSDATQMTPDVPTAFDMTPDGLEVLKIGDLNETAEFISHQGDNAYHFKGTCGLVSCANVLREFGLNVDENDVVRHAATNLECVVYPNDFESSGGTVPESDVRLLGDYGVAAHVETDKSLEGLAANVEAGHGVIIGVNAGLLWDDAKYFEHGQANHAITVHGVARDAVTGEVVGFYVTDSGRSDAADADRFISATTMELCHLMAGGTCVVTDGSWIDVRPPATV